MGSKTTGKIRVVLGQKRTGPLDTFLSRKKEKIENDVVVHETVNEEDCVKEEVNVKDKYVRKEKMAEKTASEGDQVVLTETEEDTESKDPSIKDDDIENLADELVRLEEADKEAMKEMRQ
eukprot:Ihof_evm10s177 gene=Ihof_evmTU10s177